MAAATSALTRRRSRRRGLLRSARSGTCRRRRPRSTAEGWLVVFGERLEHGLDYIQRHRRGAALRRKHGGEFEVDARQEAADDDAAGGKLLRGEGIADRDPEPRRHHAAHDLRERGLDPEHAADIVAMEDLIDEVAARRARRQRNESLALEIAGLQHFLFREAVTGGQYSHTRRRRQLLARQAG